MREPDRIVSVNDESIGLRGWLVIDSSIHNRSVGGVRMMPDVTLDEVRALARSMTLKLGFSSFPRGGAKGGIITKADDSDERKAVLLRRFGEIIYPYIKSGEYLPGSDMGSSPRLILDMLAHLGVTPGKRSTGGKLSGFWTGLGVAVSIETMVDALGSDFSSASFAVEGFGSVGSALAQILHQKGGRVVAISNRDGALLDRNGLDIPKFIESKRTHGTGWLPRVEGVKHLKKEELLELDVDVLSPCGRSGQINEENVDRIRAKVICAGANNPVTPAAEEALLKKGIVFLPDFATNCGGVLGNGMEMLGLKRDDVELLLRTNLGPKYVKLLELSEKSERTTTSIAKEIARENALRMKSTGERQKTRARIVHIGLDLYKRGFFPRSFIRPFARRYFSATLSRDSGLYEIV